MSELPVRNSVPLDVQERFTQMVHGMLREHPNIIEAIKVILVYRATQMNESEDETISTLNVPRLPPRPRPDQRTNIFGGPTLQHLPGSVKSTLSTPAAQMALFTFESGQGTMSLGEADMMQLMGTPTPIRTNSSQMQRSSSLPTSDS